MRKFLAILVCKLGRAVGKLVGKGSSMPGKFALKICPDILARVQLPSHIIAVTGSNGKTSTVEMIAAILRAGGKTVVYNEEGSNQIEGVTTLVLTHASLTGRVRADVLLIESDERYAAQSFRYFHPTEFVITNLYRDQLTRNGHPEWVYDAILPALHPETELILNADDPLSSCFARGRDRVKWFGLDRCPSDTASPTGVYHDGACCPVCHAPMEYDYVHYNHIGAFRCTKCGHHKPATDYTATALDLGRGTLTIDSSITIQLAFRSIYNVYNILAAYAACRECGVAADTAAGVINNYILKNGRMQKFTLGEHRGMLLTSKHENSIAYDTNLRYIRAAQEPCTVLVIVDAVSRKYFTSETSWLWDIDFEELAGQDVVVFAGGLRRNDLQVRLKYAGLKAQLVDTASAVLANLSQATLPAGGPLPADANVYLIANYTALPPVHDELDCMVQEGRNAQHVDGLACRPAPHDAEAPARKQAVAADGADAAVPTAAPDDTAAASDGAANAQPASPLVIAHLFPDLLNLYGDGGNVRILEQRCRWRGIPVEVRRVNHGETIDLDDVDLVFLGGGPDREQRMASEDLMRMKDDLRAFVEADGTLLAICGGYQILGRTWLLGDEVVEGLGILDIETQRAGTSADRLIGDIVLGSSLAALPVIGYENHAGRTCLGGSVEPFGSVEGSVGHGNNDDGNIDGVRYRNVTGTYLHGPLLSKNPEVADALLASALKRRATRLGIEDSALGPLDDGEERAANAFMRARLGVK